MKKPFSQLTGLGCALLDLFAPPLCPLCAEFPPSGHAGLCTDCHLAIKAVREPFCPVCALPFEGTGPSHACSLCAKRPPPFVATRALGHFDGSLRQAIRQFKYHGNLALRNALLELFTTMCLSEWGEKGAFDAVTPVPCHREDLVKRGFDLPALLSRKVAKSWGVPWRPDALIKTRPGVGMAGLTLKERTRAVAGLYRKGQRVSGRVLLVDDVITSTATVRAAARGLLRAGAVEVFVAALARTPTAPQRVL